MKKISVAALIVGAFILYSLFYHSNAVFFEPSASNQPSAGTNTSSTSSTVSTPSAPGTSGPGAYKDGTYTGSVDDAIWGNVQVQIVIQNGNLASVQFLQYPNERNRSIEINTYADPILCNEAIAAQSANVDIVTGATDTSDAFIQSLTDALTQAK